MPKDDMPTGETRETLEPYLVVPNRKLGAGSADLLPLVEAVRDRGDVELEMTGGQERPIRLRLRASARAIADLRERFGGRLLLEPDRPLRF